LALRFCPCAGGSLEPRPAPGQLDLALVHVRRDADRRRLVAHRTLTGLADPPGGVGRELVAAPPVELLDRAVQADHAFLDQVAELHAAALVALRDRDHEPEVGVDHQLLGRQVSTLDALGQRHFVRSRQQPVAARRVHEEAQAVGRPRDLRGGLCARRRSGVVLDGHDLDALGIKLCPELGQILGLELVRDGECLQGRLVDEAELLGFVDKRLEIKFSKVGQGVSLLSIHSAGPF
jgi:hypothetical protein